MKNQKSRIIIAGLAFVLAIIVVSIGCKKMEKKEIIENDPGNPVTLNYSINSGSGGGIKSLQQIEVAIVNGSTVYLPDSTQIAFWLDPTTSMGNWTLTFSGVILNTWANTSQIDHSFLSPGTYVLTVVAAPPSVFPTITVTVVITQGMNATYDISFFRSSIDIPGHRFGYTWHAPIQSIAYWANPTSTFFLVAEEFANNYSPVYANIAPYGVDSVEFTLFYPWGYLSPTTEKFNYGADSIGPKHVWATHLSGPFMHPSDTIYWFKPVNGSCLTATDTYAAIGGTLGDNLTNGLPVFRYTVTAGGGVTTFTLNFFHLGTAAPTARYKIGAGGIYTSLPIPTKIGNSYNYTTSLVVSGSGIIYFQWGEGAFTASPCMAISGPAPTGYYYAPENAIQLAY